VPGTGRAPRSRPLSRGVPLVSRSGERGGSSAELPSSPSLGSALRGIPPGSPAGFPPARLPEGPAPIVSWRVFSFRRRRSRRRRAGRAWPLWFAPSSALPGSGRSCGESGSWRWPWRSVSVPSACGGSDRGARRAPRDACAGSFAPQLRRAHFWGGTLALLAPSRAPRLLPTPRSVTERDGDPSGRVACGGARVPSTRKLHAWGLWLGPVPRAVFWVRRSGVLGTKGGGLGAEELFVGAKERFLGTEGRCFGRRGAVFGHRGAVLGMKGCFWARRGSFWAPRSSF